MNTTAGRVIPQMEPWYGAEEREAIAAYMDSGGWGTEFTRTRDFEDLVARAVGSRYCLVTPNGTIALTLALLGLGIGAGDEVIVPDYTMIASATAVVLAGATPVLVDIDPTTLCLDVPAISAALTPRTRAVMIVSINGRSPDMGAISTLAHDKGIQIIEDAAQSLGCYHLGKHLGTFGIVGCFSFSIHKLVSTGNGGAVITNDEALYRTMQRIKDFGRPRAACGTPL